MKKINLELAQQHKLIAEKCNELLKVVLIEDKDVIIEIMNKSLLEIENYNQENLTILNPTKTEIGLFNSMLKRIVDGKYIIPSTKLITKPESNNEDYLCDKEELQKEEYDGKVIEYYDYKLFCNDCKRESDKRDDLISDYYEKIKKIKLDFNNACNSTIIPNELLLRKISLGRSIIDKYYPTQIQKVLNKEIHKELMSIFEEQNKDLLKKYNF